MRVLLIEDYESFGKALHEHLTKQNFEVVYLSNGKNAIHVIENDELGFDAIISDFELGYGQPNGAQIMAVADTMQPEALLISFSGLDRSYEYAAAGLELDYILVKNDIEKLVEVLNSERRS